MELARQIDEMWETGALDAAVVERAIGSSTRVRSGSPSPTATAGA